MVYRGPSRGCLNCKNRRIKCDSGRPSCGACFKRNEVCIRFEHALDAVLRDQSAKLLGHATNRKASLFRQSWAPSCLSDARSRHLVKPTINPDISSTEAVYFFLQCYAWKANNLSSTFGYIDLLPALYLQSSPDSPLVHTITALAVYLQEAWSDLFPETDRARKYLGRALQSVNKALADPDESVKDSTLIAVLLLDLQDSLSSAIQSLPAAETHFDGVIALINHRGALNYETEIARRLITAVRHQIITCSNERGFRIDSTAPIWNDTESIPDMPGNKMRDLDDLCLRLNVLGTTRQTTVKSEHCSPYTPSPRDENMLTAHSFDCFKQLKCLEEAFEAWYKTVPEQWQPLSVHGASHFDPYQMICHVYPDLSVAITFNNYRTSRATVLKWLVEMSSRGGGFWKQQEASFRDTFQKLMDEFCASIPFFIGNKFSAEHFENPNVFYPGFPDDTERNRENRRLATAYGGMILLSTLRSMLDLSDPTKTIGEPLARAGQREWMMRQLLRIAIMYNFRVSPNNLEGTIPPLVAERAALGEKGKADVVSIGEGVAIRI